LTGRLVSLLSEIRADVSSEDVLRTVAIIVCIAAGVIAVVAGGLCYWRAG
jgi:hypothetical protein